MIKKIYIQSLLILSLLIISLFLFFKYFKKSEIENDLKRNIEQSINTSENFIEDLKYLSTDREGNKYEIEAKTGNIDKINPDIIYLENVKAVISFQNSDFISIESKFAKYNTKNFVWGAVPRSGKSFMIGGLIAKEKSKVILLYLGAITETKEQFI